VTERFEQLVVGGEWAKPAVAAAAAALNGAAFWH
jgi:hypothetical protein